MSDLICRRIMLKLSGEVLTGQGAFGIDPAVLRRMAGEIRELTNAGAEVGMVIGGGNIFRGAGLAQAGIDRVSADHMGMLATVMNALAMQDALQQLGVEARALSALRMDQVCEFYVCRKALQHLRRGRVVIIAGGTGNPYFTTDSAASLRAVELGVQLMIKATKVDGIYAADPVREPDAAFYPRLSYDQVLAENLQVMDTTAVVLCRDSGIPLRVMNINRAGALLRLMQGEEIGSLVGGGD